METPSTKEVKKYWINNARYDWYTARKKGSILERLFYNFKIKFILSTINFKNKKILDLACGTGLNTHDFYKLSKHTIGVDLSPWAIERAKQNFPNVDFRVMDSEKLKFKDNTFDIIVNTGLIQYLKDTEKTFDEMYRILKPGGLILIEVPWRYSFYNSMFLRRLITGKKNPNDEPVNKTYSAKDLKKVAKKFKCLSIHNFYSIVLYGVFRK